MHSFLSILLKFLSIKGMYNYKDVVLATSKYKQLKLKFFLLCTLHFTIISTAILARTEQLPEWYRLNAYFSTPPKLNETLEVFVEFSSLNVSISSVTIKILFPQSWKEISSTTAYIQNISPNRTEKIKFELLPLSYISLGSVVVLAYISTPKSELLNIINQEPSYQSQIEIYSNSINNLPIIIQTACDIAFSLTEYESFYPLSNDMWLLYDNRINVQNQFLGPVLYKDDLISIFQAQTDVEMFEKLKIHLQSNPTFEQTLKTNGIDLAKKKTDFINGLYMLALEAYLKSDFNESIKLINRLNEEINDNEKTIYKHILIRAGNLKALNYWSLGNKRMAEETFRQTFYIDKKAKEQRYVLRNMGLLMLYNGDIKAAKEMFRLALDYKPQYFLLQSEFNKIITK